MPKERTILHTLDSRSIHTICTVGLLAYVIVMVSTISIMRQAPLSKREKVPGIVSVTRDNVRVQPIAREQFFQNLEIGSDVSMSIGKDAASRGYTIVDVQNRFFVLSPHNKQYEVPVGKHVIGIVFDGDGNDILSEIFNMHNSER